MAIVKRCAYCGQLYKATRRTSLYCGGKCRTAAYREGIVVEYVAPHGKEVLAATAQLRSDANAFRDLATNAPRRYRETCKRVADGLDELLDGMDLYDEPATDWNPTRLGRN